MWIRIEGWNEWCDRMPQEAHLIHEFPEDFYGEELRAVVMGYLRPELDFSSLGACRTRSRLPLPNLPARTARKCIIAPCSLLLQTSLSLRSRTTLQRQLGGWTSHQRTTGRQTLTCNPQRSKQEYASPRRRIPLRAHKVAFTESKRCVTAPNNIDNQERQRSAESHEHCSQLCFKRLTLW